MKKSLLLVSGSFILSTTAKGNLQSNLTYQEISNPTTFYYQENKQPVVVASDWYQKNEDWKLIATINLGAINPTRYRLLRFLGQEQDYYTRVSWGNVEYFGRQLKNFSFIFDVPQTKITNKKIANPYDVPKYVTEDRFFILQDFAITWSLATFLAKQYFVLTWYYENGNYYLQVFSYYYVRVTGSWVGGEVWLGIGTGIVFLVTDTP